MHNQINASGKANVIQLHNPFDNCKDREIDQIDAGFTIKDWVDSHPETKGMPFIIMLNGTPILRKDWGVKIVLANDILSIKYLPQGGGGGKNPLVAIIGIILIAVAVVFTAGLVLIALVAVGLAMVAIGSGLLGVPETPTTHQLPSPSPTYSTGAQGNTARIGNAIPVMYGYNRIYPDFATAPYAYFDDGDQFLNHVLVVGQGEIRIDEVLIEDTPISSFKEIEYEIVEPGDPVTLFEPSVVSSLEVAGQELFGPNESDHVVGPFIINPPETTTKKLEVDIVLARGLYSAADDGTINNATVRFIIWTQRIDDDGEPLQEWYRNQEWTLQENTVDPIRRTYPILVDQGRYQIKLERINNKNLDTKVGNKIQWSGAKAYIEEPADYGDLTLIAVRMRATDNLSNRSSRKINVFAQRLLPIWHPDTGWSEPQETKSAVWALCDALKADYGGQLGDNRIDLQNLYDLDQELFARGDEFNGIFDNKMSLWEALRLIGRVVRCAGIMQGGVFRLVRDRLQTIPVAMFTPRNIVKDSFSIKFMMASEDTVDGVTIQYMNPKTWQLAEVSSDHEGNAPENPAEIRLFGCTNKEQALREARYLSLNNIYRRMQIKLTTEMEGNIPTFGDLVAVSHDMPDWGYSGDILSVDSEGNFTTTQDFEEFKGEAVVAFRTRAGGMVGPFAVEQNEYANEFRLSGDWIFNRNESTQEATITNGIDNIRVYTGTKEERTHFALGKSNIVLRYGVVKAVRPRGEFKVELEILSEDERVHIV